MLPPSAVDAAAPFGLRVLLGPVPPPPGGAVPAPDGVVVDGDRVWAADPGRWSLLVERGRDVTVDWSGGGPVPSWLVGSWAVTIALLQRGHLCLHASLVRVGERVVAVAGVSGAGKSTAVLGLHDRGCTVLVDDVVVVERPESDARVRVFPRPVLVTDETRAALGWDPTRMDGFDLQARKWTWTPPIAAGPDVVTVDVVAVIVVDPAATEVGTVAVRGAEKVPVLMADVARPRTGPLLMGTAAHFTAVGAFAGAVDVVRVVRPADGWTVGAVGDALLALGSR